MTSKVQRSSVQDGQVALAARIDTDPATGRPHVGASDRGARRPFETGVDFPSSVIGRGSCAIADFPFGETRTDSDLEGAS